MSNLVNSHNSFVVFTSVFVHEAVRGVCVFPEVVVLYKTAYWFLRELWRWGGGGGGGGGVI